MPSKIQSDRYKEKYGEKMWLQMESDRIKAYYETHPGKRKEANRKWDGKNRLAYSREYRRKKKLNNTPAL